MDYLRATAPWLAELKGSIAEARQRMIQESPEGSAFCGFLGFDEQILHRDIEDSLTRLLMAPGGSFAFVGRQFRLEIGGDEFFIDLLFYHTRLKCYVVVQLGTMAFKPEHAGKLNFYLAAVDAQIKAEDDKPTIGLLLCLQPNRLVAEYSLSGVGKPMSVAKYQLVRELPENLRRSLPSSARIETALANEMGAGYE